MLEKIEVKFKHSAWCGKAGWYEESVPGTINKIRRAFEGLIQPIIIITNASKVSRSGKVMISKHRATGHFCDAWDDMEDIYINLGMDVESLSLSDMIPVSALLCSPGVEIDFAIQTTDLTKMYDLVDAEEEKLITLSEMKWQQLETYCTDSQQMDTTWDDDEIQFPRLIAHAIAAGAFTDDIASALCNKMDITAEQLDSLLERGRTVWEEHKAAM